MTVPFDYLKPMVEKMKAERVHVVRTEKLATEYSSDLTITDELADFVAEVPVGQTS